jgi:hypothetical protein
LIDLGFELKAQGNLHAKVYITTRAVIIGSANASINGLGDEDNEDFKLEAAIVSFDTTIIRDAGVWFNKHWDSAEIVDKPTLKGFKPFWLQKTRKSK